MMVLTQQIHPAGTKKENLNLLYLKNFTLCKSPKALPYTDGTNKIVVGCVYKKKKNKRNPADALICVQHSSISPVCAVMPNPHMMHYMSRLWIEMHSGSFWPIPLYLELTGNINCGFVALF